MSKLTGDEYLQYWRNRMAKGPEQAAFDGKAEEMEVQGGIYFAEMMRCLGKASQQDPKHYHYICEVGSGYGRMLERFRKIFTASLLYGVDVCEEAIEKSWRDSFTMLCCAYRVPEGWKSIFDLVFTCTCLQHVTDEGIYRELIRSIEDSLVYKGTLLILENTSRPGAPHVRDMTSMDYRADFPQIEWDDGTFFFKYKGQEHCVIRGVKR